VLFFKQCPVSYNTPYEKIGDEVRSLADEVPFDIPDSWEWVRLGNISSYAETKQKVNATSADPSIWGLDLEDIEKGGRLLEYKTVGERKAVGDKTIFTKGDILYSKLRPYLLKILVAPDDGICTPEIVPFRVYGGIDPSYIVNYLKSPYVDKKIEKMKAMMGSTVQKVPAVKPTASKFVDYKGVNKLPMQGGACTPK
jgi:type I restriction enzyme, S subunit